MHWPPRTSTGHSVSANAIRRRDATGQWSNARTTGAAATLAVRMPFRQVAAIGGDMLALGAIVFSIPFVILGIGLPIALLVQLLLWITRLF